MKKALAAKIQQQAALRRGYVQSDLEARADHSARQASSRPVTLEMFRYHHDGEAEIRASFLCLLTDAAYSKREGADLVALLVAAVTPDNYWDVLEYTRDHLDPRAFLNRIWHYWDKYKPLGGLQRITVQSATLDQVLAFFLNEDMRTRDEYLPVHGISVDGQDKVKRIERAVTRLRMERLRLTRAMPELEDEFLRFPKSPYNGLTAALSDMAEIAPAVVPTGRPLALDSRPTPHHISDTETPTPAPGVDAPVCSGPPPPQTGAIPNHSRISHSDISLSVPPVPAVVSPVPRRRKGQGRGQ